MILEIPPDLFPEELREFGRVLNDRLKAISHELETPAPEATVSVDSSVTTLAGSHATRIALYPADKLRVGTQYYETDRKVTYTVIRSAPTTPKKWVYGSGEMSGTLSPNQKPSLGTDDAGFRFRSTDFLHTYIWSGSAWALAPGEFPPGFIGWFETNPGTGWQLCDGSAGVSRSTPTGGTTTFTVADMLGSGGAYLKGNATYSATPVAAANGSITGSTASEGAHTHAIDHDHPSFTSGTPSAAASYTAGGVDAATGNHTHSIDVPNYTGASGAGSSHSHAAGTLAVSGADPRHVNALPYSKT